MTTLTSPMLPFRDGSDGRDGGDDGGDDGRRELKRARTTGVRGFKTRLENHFLLCCICGRHSNDRFFILYWSDFPCFVFGFDFVCI